MKKNAALLFVLFLIASGFHSAVQSQNLSDFINPFSTIDEMGILFDEIDQQKLVLMGEASHGTSEFYVWRAEMSKKLITEKGYNFIAVEGDWAAMSRINEFVKHKPGAPESIENAMDYIERWPLWMWRNHEVKSLIQWLHDHNRNIEPEQRVGFYGVDLYAKRDAMKQVVSFFEEVNPDMTPHVENAYSCITRFRDIQGYLRMVQQSGEGCELEMNQVLDWVRESDGFNASEWRYFNAELSAKAVKNADEHYRGNLMPGAASWNSRASHFYSTADRLLEFYGEESKGIVWAHNTHIGDARATDMGRQGAVNIGQLAKEDLGEENVFAIGFGTYEGRVLAGRQWEGPMEIMETPQARINSWEATLTEYNEEKFFLLFNNPEINNLLQNPVAHRAIGVMYQPEQDAQRNYVNTVMPDRYNAFIFIRETDILDTLD